MRDTGAVVAVSCVSVGQWRGGVITRSPGRHWTLELVANLREVFTPCWMSAFKLKNLLSHYAKHRKIGWAAEKRSASRTFVASCEGSLKNKRYPGTRGKNTAAVSDSRPGHQPPPARLNTGARQSRIIWEHDLLESQSSCFNSIHFELWLIYQVDKHE